MSSLQLVNKLFKKSNKKTWCHFFVALGCLCEMTWNVCLPVKPDLAPVLRIQADSALFANLQSYSNRSLLRFNRQPHVNKGGGNRFCWRVSDSSGPQTALLMLSLCSPERVFCFSDSFLVKWKPINSQRLLNWNQKPSLLEIGKPIYLLHISAFLLKSCLSLAAAQDGIKTCSSSQIPACLNLHTGLNDFLSCYYTPWVPALQVVLCIDYL